MHVTLRLFGLEVIDLDLTTTTTDEDKDRDLSGGSTVSTPVGYAGFSDNEGE